MKSDSIRRLIGSSCRMALLPAIMSTSMMMVAAPVHAGPPIGDPNPVLRLTETLRLVETNAAGGLRTWQPQPKHSTASGWFPSTRDLADADGKLVGRVATRPVLNVAGGGVAAMHVFTYLLPRGQITAHRTERAATPNGYGAAIVTGGTGAYAGARGLIVRDCGGQILLLLRLPR